MIAITACVAGSAGPCDIIAAITSTPLAMPRNILSIMRGVHHCAHDLIGMLCLFGSAIGPGADTGLAEIVHGSPGEVAEDVGIVVRDLATTEMPWPDTTRW